MGQDKESQTTDDVEVLVETNEVPVETNEVPVETNEVPAQQSFLQKNKW